jgi:hypothetical protein
VPGAQGARLRAPEGNRQRSLREVYNRMSAASRAHPRWPGFWSKVASNIRGQRG